MNDTTPKIRQLFSSNISQTIEEVIKVDQDGIREECTPLIGAGKKVIVQ